MVISLCWKIVNFDVNIYLNQVRVQKVKELTHICSTMLNESNLFNITYYEIMSFQKHIFLNFTTFWAFGNLAEM